MLADDTAKVALYIPSPPDSVLTPAAAKLWDIEMSDMEKKNYWLMNTQYFYTAFEVVNFDRHPDQLSLSRHLLAHLHAGRFGYGDFATYHTRLSYINSHNSCSSEELNSPRLSLEFSKILQLLPKRLKSLGNVLKFFLGTSLGAKKLTTWMSSTFFFRGICLRFSRCNNPRPPQAEWRCKH